MSKRPTDGPSPAAKKLKENVDTMGCIIMCVKRSNDNLAREVGELKETNNYLHRQVERLDAYSTELENRMAAMEAVLSNLLNSPGHWQVEEMIHQIQATRSYDTTDLDRLLEEAETEDEEDLLAGFFDDWAQA
jgi:FtsZ-binding cell division protein ZapB